MKRYISIILLFSSLSLFGQERITVDYKNEGLNALHNGAYKASILFLSIEDVRKPNQKDILLALSEAYLNDGQYEKAEHCLRRFEDNLSVDRKTLDVKNIEDFQSILIEYKRILQQGEYLNDAGVLEKGCPEVAEPQSGSILSSPVH